MEDTPQQLIANMPSELLARMLAFPAPEATELGDVLEHLVLHALQTFDAMPQALQQMPMSVLNTLLSGWMAEVDVARLQPLRRIEREPEEVVKLGESSLPASALETMLAEDVPPLHRSVLTTVVAAVELVLFEAPKATRAEQASGVVALLRRTSGWLLPQFLDTLSAMQRGKAT